MPYKDKRKQKQAQSDWYQKNKYNISNRKNKMRAEARQWVQEYKIKNSVCTDCQNSYPHYMLDFDHVKDKSFGISRALQLGTNLDKIKEEVKKCEIVCANCHRHRTYERQKLAS